MLDKLTKAFAEANLDEECDRWLADNVGTVRFEFSPQRWHLAFEPEHAVFDYWQAMEMVEGVGQNVVVDPYSLKPALGSIMLLDVLKGGESFFYSLYGSRIANHSGFDMTHKHLTELPSRQPIQTFMLAGYRAVVQSRRPLLTVHPAPDDIMIGSWRRLQLPLGRGGEVTRIMVCNLAVAENGDLK